MVENANAPEPEADEKGRLDRLENSVSSLRAYLTEQVQATRRGTRSFLIIAAIVFVVIVAYLSYLFTYINGFFSEPKMIAGLIRARAIDSLPRYASTLESELVARAPGLADDISKAVMDMIPKIRAEAQKRVARIVKDLVRELEVRMEPELDKLIKENKAILAKYITQASDEEKAKELRKEFKRTFEQALARDVDREMAKFFEAMDSIEKKLTTLITKEDLSPEETWEKEMITSWVIFVHDAMAEGEKELLGAKEKGEKPGMLDKVIKKVTK